MPCDHAEDKSQASQYSKITDFASNFFTKLAKSVILWGVLEGGIFACVNGENGHI